MYYVLILQDVNSRFHIDNEHLLKPLTILEVDFSPSRFTAQSLKKNIQQSKFDFFLKILHHNHLEYVAFSKDLGSDMRKQDP